MSMSVVERDDHYEIGDVPGAEVRLVPPAGEDGPSYRQFLSD